MPLIQKNSSKHIMTNMGSKYGIGFGTAKREMNLGMKKRTINDGEYF